MPSAVVTGVQINRPGVNEVLRGINGPVVRDLAVRGERVKRRAIATCPVSEEDPVPGRRKPRRPGTLKNSIVKRIDANGAKVPSVSIGSQLGYAIIVHEGSAGGTPITPKYKSAEDGGRLVFMWKKKARIVYLKQVTRASTRPNRWLLRALTAARD